MLDNTRDPRAVEVTALLNEGYKRSGRVPRCEEHDGEWQIRWYRVYSPKVLLKIGDFSGTLLSRGIVIPLTKTYKLPQSFFYLIQEEAKPLRELLEPYAVQKRPALEEIYKQERDQNSWPFLTAREYEIWMPLLLHARLIGNECGEEGRKFEAKAVEVVSDFTAAKTKLVITEDERLARALELLEALEGRLGRLLATKRVSQEWKKSTSNRITAGALVNELSEKESWGNYLEGRKNDKAKATSIGRFLRSFKPESEHDENGTQYNLLDLARRLADHLPPRIPHESEERPVNFRTLLENLDEPSVAPPPSSPGDDTEVSNDTSFDPSDNTLADTSNGADTSNFQSVSCQPVSNEEAGRGVDTLTPFEGGIMPAVIAGGSLQAKTNRTEAKTHTTTPTEKSVKVSASPPTYSLLPGYELTLRNSDVSVPPEVLAKPPDVSGMTESDESPDIARNNDDDRDTDAGGDGFIVEDL